MILTKNLQSSLQILDSSWSRYMFSSTVCFAVRYHTKVRVKVSSMQRLIGRFWFKTGTGQAVRKNDFRNSHPTTAICTAAKCIIVKVQVQKLIAYSVRRTICFNPKNWRIFNKNLSLFYSETIIILPQRCTFVLRTVQGFVSDYRQTIRSCNESPCWKERRKNSIHGMLHWKVQTEFVRFVMNYNLFH